MIARKRPRFYKGELSDILKLAFRKEAGSGKYIEEFEDKFAAYTGTKFAVATCSGRSAMMLLLEGMGLKEGDEVIMSAYTLKDLVHLLKEKGIVPKLVDIEKDSFNIDPELIEKEITAKTRVIIATHIFGLPCDIEKILDIAEKHGLKVIEDCAHAAGVTVNGKKAGSFGDAGFFSLETSKPVNAFGGGVVTTSDPGLRSFLRKRHEGFPFTPNKVLTKILFSYIEHLVIKSFLFRVLSLMFAFKFTTKIISILYLSVHKQARVEHSRFTNVQALVGLRQLAELDERNRKRGRIAGELRPRLEGKMSSQRSALEGGRIYYFFMVLAPGGEPLELIRRRLLISGVDAGIKGEVTDDCSLIAAAGPEGCPVAKHVYSRALQLPMHDDLRERDIDFIAGKIYNMFGNGNVE